ncbi:uncharacterized protein LOC108261273 [Ictalurus punctatus]|uniref:exodeoxyribonuclease III n=1 Tax=Ictalurus punctatus TaxID=7998 RepID=A0A2D0QH35_ICTPU|nr:uncharacterized protein LOC108261273 [Ictalurus punctatus]XP_017317669.2 uncharacterized protein LOC108261273 [Ictalurus punctatus]XP_047009705.2 uncharacterized protein LOC108261273 [Ictalurus punctatus]XP_053536253.1 uncharacterized protein LOC108261273 [Ictalurus punctatus]XP_053536255.1 uncharacterized protein LOC108261273 [Ictalurus punctatus]
MTMQAEQKSLFFVTWNTNGIRDTRKSPQKFSNIFKSLRDLQADIVFIQETHVGTDCYKILEDVPGWKVFFTVHNSRSKGVVILIKDKVKFEYICHDEDFSGGYIVLFCRLHHELYTLVNVYNNKSDRNVLGRLKDYLMETAEGVLVVGGDFNTVLHPCFDRRSLSSNARHSQFRAFLEDFTVSLNLRDTWSYKRPTDEGFTRRQNDSHSRIDMFFLPEHKLGRVCKINVAEAQGVSDHYPLVLELTVQQRTETNLPNVALKLPKPFKYTPDRRPGKISGAEILSAIKSLTDLKEYSLDMKDVKSYKKRRCQLTETLKIKYNSMIENKAEGERNTLEYLIFSQILAKRLNATISPSFKGKIATKHYTFSTVKFEAGPQKIKWSFLEIKLKNLQPGVKKPKQSPSAPPPEFSILEHFMDCLLPKDQSSSELRLLEPGCPLTNAIFNLALNELEAIVLRNFCKGTICYQRQVLRVHTPPITSDFVDFFINVFKKQSGLKISISQHPD